MDARVGAEPVVLLSQGGELAERILELAHHGGIWTERRCLAVRREAVELKNERTSRETSTHGAGRAVGDFDVHMTLTVLAPDGELDDLEGVEREQTEVIGAVSDESLEHRERDRELSGPRLARFQAGLAPCPADEGVGDLGQLVRTMGAVLQTSAWRCGLVDSRR